ncbi:acylneuraminate cytidylyltransferase family protein [Thalassotalea sp. PP2-459]|uniref:acylneuraminate cytidylyltransferase family protein n=1 Tax=Thalassotalea sp. PP2-459 TaxID=1742724 RepID=UPI000944EB0C|nr:acylneuraminate cytidylyltransferase family protein [Thalassotalea sp. PP2-459]OKY24701.1 CMP-N-acetlyneuraminic acid synthetase [Thalassotalea sp. PP2-459]
MVDKILAVIPARAGSKRLPGKNSKMLCGKPLVQWTIEAAQQALEISDIIVSTDCENIADIAKQSGVSVPFLRPDSISGDEATAIDVVRHTANYLTEQGKSYDYVIWLQPTSPLRTVENIQHAIQVLKDKQASAVISVCECDHSPMWSNTLASDGNMQNFISTFVKKNPRSQALPTYYRLNGAIYIAKIEQLLEQETFFLDSNVYSYVMKREDSVDIDHHLDFKLAEFLLDERQQVT